MATTWKIDPTHSAANFSVKHMMVTTVRGHFNEIDGTIDFDEANPAASQVNVEIKVASIDTGVADRDNHLRSADFFDVANFPKITFRSTKVEVTGKNEGRITGDLTIRGVTRPVVIETEFLGSLKDPWGNDKVAFSGETKINREDFGLTWNVALETGG
ncbi:MAG: YceI family protein, partial [Anaerolineae bacterium]|nr:YceI family protein [Anaerolineae bacterium]